MTAARGPQAVAAAIDDLLDTPGLDGLVSRYFDPATNFAADTFNTLGQNEPFSVSADDLLAVGLLDTPMPPSAVRGMLGADAPELGARLNAIDPIIDVWAPDADEPLAGASTLWAWLQAAYTGLGPVRAGKFLARKRPRLVPVVDDVVIRVLPATQHEYWEAIRFAFQDQPRRERIAALRPPRVDERITSLRLLDVAIWMLGSRSEAARRERSALAIGPLETGHA